MKLQFCVWLNRENTQNSKTEIFIICIFTLDYYGDQSKTNKKDVACSMHRGNKKCNITCKPSCDEITPLHSLESLSW